MLSLLVFCLGIFSYKAIFSIEKLSSLVDFESYFRIFVKIMGFVISESSKTIRIRWIKGYVRNGPKRFEL